MKHILTISSPDAQGIIAKVATILSAHHLNIEKNDEHVDLQKHHFFMRTEFSGECQIQDLLREIKDSLSPQSQVHIKKEEKKSIIILCTKENHCLGDLLLRYESGELNAHIQAIISNHTILQSLSEKFEIPFFHVDSQHLSREEHEAEILKITQNFSPDLLVLAKYMRILTPNFVSHFPNQIINIHHSFLPAFIGANPYKQAYERGVKIIGATAHFVNDHLDEGPIIVQDIIHIDHSYSWQDMQRAGRDVEKVVLARGLNLVLQDRVFVFENKTIIF
ncbi:formyltetrahydrofolate deformylase [Helicobacter kayseriensis]|uniref:formyltetrahydrofolate deformylase n=1 Tax=Helicobacter kayseriensis TaxID=2905877 RepID=UPI001E39D1F1|nr:formyltetrahydrofolate deformylase [Helicobacter kayseriensis]MCE3046878.1 formyltetrahydrofolate deformylase [Helicobacter kayseriensis]MCE3048462.1 formyltetrahydrofolate deformylase [Helicobacter kayseriensis]